MIPNLIPTEQEIELQAALVHPNNPELRASFIEAVWNTVYTMKICQEEN